MFSNVVDQAAQAYIYLIIYVCVGITEADATGHTQNLLKTGDFTPFDRNTKYFDWNTRFFIWSTRYFENMWQ